MRSLRARLWLAAIVVLVAGAAVAWTLLDLAPRRPPPPAAPAPVAAAPPAMPAPPPL
ncbi:MAG: hypothetical protein INR64_15705, partial [Caulobacteraceae bacterium]|nr:hypothetical protein [Caulobacter sp.]